MISKLTLEGFKSFKFGELALSPFTLLTGLNSSGKSSVIQAILMGEKAVKDNNFLLDEHGTVRELTNIYGNEFKITLKDDHGGSIALIGKDDTQKVEQIGNEAVDFPTLFYSEAGRFGSQSSIRVFNNTAEMDSKGNNLLKCIDTYAEYEIPDSLLHPKAQGVTYLYNLRAWLELISPNIDFSYNLQKLSDQSFSYFDDHRATNVGFGLSYTLPIIAVLLRASLSKNSLVLLENPEAHLHPKGQTELGKFIALCADNGINVVVETHSDHLFDGVRLYTKEHPTFAPKFLSYWFE